MENCERCSRVEPVHPVTRFCQPCQQEWEALTKGVEQVRPILRHGFIRQWQEVLSKIFA